MRGSRAVALAVALGFVAVSCGSSGNSAGTVAQQTPAATQAPAAAPAVTVAPIATGAPVGTNAPVATDAKPAAAPKAGPGFDGSTIQVGVITALSGPAALIGTPLAAGQQVYFDYLNAEKGGVAGKYPVKIVLEDSQYDTSVTVQKYSKIKSDVVMFSQIMGTASVLATLPLLKEDGMVAAPASQDAFWLREQNLFPVIEPYQIDVINAMSYYLGAGGGSTSDTICAVIQNDVYGEAGLEGLQAAAKELGFKVATTTRYAAGDTDFTAQVTELSNKKCAMVFATALPTEFAGILGVAAQRGFEPRWIGQSPAWVDELAGTPLKDYLQQHVWIAALGREWGDSASKDMTALVARAAKYKPDQQPDYYFEFGYLQAWATDQLLEAAVARGDLSHEGIVTAMNGLTKLDFGDLSPSYTYGSPADRNPPRGSTIFAVNVDKPFSLAALSTNVTSAAAQAYIFPVVAP